MRYLLLPMLATVLVCGGCDDDDSDDTGGDTDTGPVECNLGEYSDYFDIEDQSDVATLAGYTSLSGTLEIECETCTDLSELICLTAVGGDLEFWDSDALTNMDGLSALTSVDGNLVISGNAALTNLDGLSALTSVDGDLGIGSNEALTSLDGLSVLTSVGGGLGIFSNHVLPDCEVCDLLDQLVSGPNEIDVDDNLDDSCTPVPANCP